MEEGAGHADTQALLHRHGLLHVQPVAPVLSQGPCGGTRISRSPAPRSPLTCPQQWQQQQQRPHLSDPGVSGRPGSEEGTGSPVAGGAAGRPAEAGEEPETHCLRRGTSQRELVPTLPRARGRPSAQRPGDLPREEPTRGRPPSRPPSRAPPSGPRAWTRTSGDTEAGAPVSPQASPSPAPLSTPGRCSTPALTGRVAASPGPWGGRSCKT